MVQYYGFEKGRHKSFLDEISRGLMFCNAHKLRLGLGYILYLRFGNWIIGVWVRNIASDDLCVYNRMFKDILLPS